MKTALTVITTAILTAIVFLWAGQQGRLGNIASTTSYPLDVDRGETNNDAQKCIPTVGTTACTTPRGERIDHGEAVLSFPQEIGTGDTGCEGITSICDDGSWYDDKTPYDFPSCTLSTAGSSTGAAGQPCQVGNIYVPHDSTHTFYAETKNADGTYRYATQQRYCFDGEIDGNTRFNKLNLISSCAIDVDNEEEDTNVPENSGTTQAPEEDSSSASTDTNQPSSSTSTQVTTSTHARCTGPFGGIWEHGKSATVYLQETVGYGQSCEAISVVCGYGSLRYGTAESMGASVDQEMYASCSVGEPVNCSSSCGEVAHGEQITTYSDDSLPYGSETSCNDIQITSTCANGILSPRLGSACSCKTEPPASCTAPNGQIVAHESALTLYQYPEVQAVAGDGSDTCIRQWRKCVNGSWYDYNGASASFTFEYPTCKVLPPPAGGGPGGEGVPQE